MKKSLVFLFLFVLQLLILRGQTKEDSLKLNLTPSQRSSLLQDRDLILSDVLSGKRVRIEKGIHAAIQLKGDTSSIDVILSGFFSDTVLLSVFEPQLDGKQIQMTFSEFKLMPLDSIDWIACYPKHPKFIYWTSMVFVIIGAELVILPLLMPLLTNDLDAYSSGSTYGMVAAGVGVFGLGLAVLHKLNPKFYYLKSPWNYRIE